MLRGFLKSVPVESRAVFVLGFLLLVAAVMIHVFSSLPHEYSWNRTLVLYWGAMTDGYFLVAALGVLVAALFFLQKISGNNPVAILADEPPERLIRLILISVAAGVALSASSTSYTQWDYVVAPAVILIVVSFFKRQQLWPTIRGLLLTILVLALVSYVFTIFKSQLFVGGVVLDEWIIGGEKIIFGLPLYSSIAEWSGQHPSAVKFSDWIYYLFFHHMALVALFLFACGDRSEQWRYVTSLSLCYLLGGLSYYAFPALGPAFFDPSKFTYLEESAKFTVFIQNLLRQSTNAAVEGRLEKIETYAFIACMPSLHMAHETIMLYFSKRSLVMFLFSMFFWLASFLAVLVLGWHYFFDVLGGFLLALIVLSAVQWSRSS